MQPTDPGGDPRDPLGGTLFVLICTALFLVISGCAAYVVINLVAMVMFAIFP